MKPMMVGVCVEVGWFKQPHPARSGWTLGVAEAAHP